MKDSNIYLDINKVRSQIGMLKTAKKLAEKMIDKDLSNYEES